jgi:hypothetical protein
LGIHKAVIFALLMLLPLVAPYGSYTGNSGALGSVEAGSSDWTEVSTWNITDDIYGPHSLVVVVLDERFEVFDCR